MLSKEEIEKAKGWLSALDVKSEFEAISKEILLQYIEQLEQGKESTYWKGYIQTQQEAMEICKMCKYRKQYFEKKVEEGNV